MDSDAQNRPMYAASADSSVPADDPRPSADESRVLQRDILEKEKERFGGFKFGSAFFGRLTATGTTVLLTALVAAVSAAVGINPATGAEDAKADGGPLAIGAAITVGIILLIAYFAGGYVAGRMARFSGIKQGLAAWIWAIVIAVIVAVVTAIAGSKWDILSNVQGLPLPMNAGATTAATVLAAVGATLVALVGAVMGGVTGMRYHRRVDRVGYSARPRALGTPAD